MNCQFKIKSIPGSSLNKFSPHCYLCASLVNMLTQKIQKNLTPFKIQKGKSLTKSNIKSSNT